MRKKILNNNIFMPNGIDRQSSISNVERKFLENFLTRLDTEKNRNNCLIVYRGTQYENLVNKLKKVYLHPPKKEVLEHLFILGKKSIDNILVVANKMIEAWFLADTDAMQKISSKLNIVNKPESYTNPSSELKCRLKKINKNYGRLSKPAMANLFISKGFSFENAAKHSQCHSAKKIC